MKIEILVVSTLLHTLFFCCYFLEVTKYLI